MFMRSDTARRTALGLAALASAAALTAGVAAPASAKTLDTDRPKITESNFDFGRNWDLIGAPRTGGYLYWDVTGGQVTPILQGYLYLKNAGGECAKIQIEHHTAAHGVLGISESPLYCAPNDKKIQFWIDEGDFSDPNIDHVVIKINVRNADGTFRTVGSTVEELGD
jgi:hypothetical protein